MSEQQQSHAGTDPLGGGEKPRRASAGGGRGGAQRIGSEDSQEASRKTADETRRHAEATAIQRRTTTVNPRRVAAQQLPAADFAPFVNVSIHSLYKWRKLFELRDRQA